MTLPSLHAPIPPNGGYGESAYGLNSYGSIEVEFPKVVRAYSVDGFTIALEFDRPLIPSPAITDPTSYTVVPTLGVPVTVLAAALANDVTVLLTVTGTTLGGQYTVTVVGPIIIDPGSTSATFLSLGTNPTMTVAPQDGSHIIFDVSEDLVPESTWSPGVDSLSSYDIETTYPIVPTITAVVSNYLGDASNVQATLVGMTSANYLGILGPSTAIAYNGSVLPDADPSFNGVEVGTGTSNIVSGELRLSKAIGATYGWFFGDTTGKIVADCTFAASITFDASAATYTLVNGVLGSFTFSDGTVEVRVDLRRIAGVDVLDIVSGAYTSQVTVDWSSGPHTLTVIRNALATLFTVLIDGTPFDTTAKASLTGVPTLLGPGVEFTLVPGTAVTNFPVDAVAITASSTVFTTSWNFIHGLTSPFVGSAANARTKFETQHGPLVRNWGDWTPATKNDVTVRINGVPVAISAVNPYLGEIYPAIPIPLTPPGFATVEVDYVWFHTPAFPMPGLNTTGAVLNKWDLEIGQRGDPTATNTGDGAPDLMRFPYGIVLGPITNTDPLQIGHRYLAYERAYSALLNTPTTLLLNQNPVAVERGDLAVVPSPTTLSFEGDTHPTDWVLHGTDTGGVLSTGYYTVVDASATDVALYTHDVDLRFPSAVQVATSLQVESYTAVGAFVGPVLGFHDDNRLYLAGPIVVNGMRHLGILLDASRPDLEESWEVGPSFPITILSSTTFRTPSAFFATAIARGDVVRFRIPDGLQAGAYTVATCGVTPAQNAWVVSITGTFPVSPNVFGGKYATAVVEVRWDEQPVVLRLVANTTTRSTTLYMGGVLASASITVPTLAATTEPADTGLLLSVWEAEQGGTIFWGAASKPGTSASRWAFVRANVTPDATTYHYSGSTVTVPTPVLPDEATTDPWFMLEGFGYAEVNGTELWVEHTAVSDTGADTTFGYGRIEPFLSNKVLVDFDATIQMPLYSGSNTALLIDNGERSVEVGLIAYVEGGTPYRQLVEVEHISATMRVNPVEEGWSQTAGTATVALSDFRGIRVTQATGLETVAWTRTLPQTGIASFFTAGFFEFDMAGTLAVNQGLRFTVVSAGHEFNIGVRTTPAFEVVFTRSDGSIFGTMPLSGDTTQRLRCRYYTLQIGIDNFLSFYVEGFGGVLINLSTAGLGSTTSRDFRIALLPASGPVATHLYAVSAYAMPFEYYFQTTFGIRSPHNGPADSIDGWVLPRSDGTNAPNSSAAATVIPMDWYAASPRFQVRLDPTWGATLYRPDLPLPSTGGPWSSDATDPSNGFINVEYARLPQSRGIPGLVAFGGVTPTVLSHQVWENASYRIRTVNSEEFLAPQGMVLNRANVINSGEWLNDTQPEVVVVPVAGRTVSLVPSHIYASRVYTVVLGSTVLAADAWSFDPDTQVITLASDPPTGVTSATVTFVAAKPVTNTYLCSQPLEQSTTLLNEGTPPVPMMQDAGPVRVVDPGTPLGPPGVSDPMGYVTFDDTPDGLYSSLEFCQVDNDGRSNLISTLCDDFTGMEITGNMVSEFQANPMRESRSGFRQEQVLVLGGGRPATGMTTVLNQSVLLPLGVYRPHSERMAIRGIIIDAIASVEAPLADTYGGATDNGAEAEIVDAISTTYGRVGPWGGLVSLTPRSLLAGGGLPPSGIGLVLGGGASLGPAPTVTNIVIPP